MQFQGSFRFMGTWPHDQFRHRVSSFPQTLWKQDTYRSERYAVHQHTACIPLIYDHDLRHLNVTHHPLYEELSPLLQPFLTRVQQSAGDGHVVRLVLLRLAAGSKIPPHTDGGISLPFVHRIHAPVITNAGVIFSVGGEKRHLAEGEIWEINNMAKHGVWNESAEDRVHLVLDWVTPELQRRHLATISPRLAALAKKRRQSERAE